MKKIFLTVGAQLPFDRLTAELIKVVACYDVRAQVGATKLELPAGFLRFMSPLDYVANVEWCDVIVSHAGMGSIITAIEFGKPLILLPRLSELGEHRNNHQLDTIAKIKSLIGESQQILFAHDEVDAVTLIETLNTKSEAWQSNNLNLLVDNIKSVIDDISI